MISSKQSKTGQRKKGGGEQKSKKNHHDNMEFLAPDGGWGWVVVIACGMSNFSTLPLGQNFGLVYKEKYEEWGITQAQYSFMRNLEFSISSCAGLISGALLRKYGFRRMSLIGGSLYAICLLITSQVTTITYFTIFFAILGGIGVGICWPSNALAINTYFKKKRGIATGFAWTATGLSPVLMPQLISILMEYTDVHGTVLVLAGISLHTIPAALLLQPVHWHGKWVEAETKSAADNEMSPDPKEELRTFLHKPRCEDHHHSNCRRASLRHGQIEGIDEDGDYIVDTQSTLGLDVTAPISRHSSRWSLGSGVHRSHAGHACDECETIREEQLSPEIVVSAAAKENGIIDEEKKPSKENISAPKPFWERCLNAIVDFFDLTIMKDPQFVVIFMGMTLAFAAEVNFALFVPFIYSEFGYDKSRVALFMSTLALVDLVTRFTVPFVTDRLKLDARLCYSVGLTILATGRIALAHADNFSIIIAATLWLGFGKGLRTVYMALVIPSYVPLHRLPTASGLQMMANGIVFMTIGPVFGHLRDSTGNYTMLLHCINILTFLAVGLWTIDSLIKKCRRTQSKKKIKINTVYKPCEEEVIDK